MSAPTPILIQGGRVIDPAREIDHTADVLLADGRVAAIGDRSGMVTAPMDARRIDAEGCLVTPGLIDIHVHFREPGDDHPETIATGSAAAIEGGFTTVCCMPNTMPALDTPEIVDLVHRRSEAAAGARVRAIACATRSRQGRELADIAGLARVGAVGFSDDGDCVESSEVTADVLRAVKDADSCFMQHCQDHAATQVDGQGAAMNAGPVAEKLGVIGWPRAAESDIVDRDVRLNREIGARYHAQHLSVAESAAILREARQAGQPVTGEVSPHHLLLTEGACAEGDTNAKMNPPLRTAADIDALKAAVADGTITILATDHAPHPESRKAVPFSEAAFGVVGVECALPLYARALVADGVVDWPWMLAMMTILPARLVGLDRLGCGSLAEDGPADVTIIDPDLQWTIDPQQFVSTGRNCPFAGWEVRGRAIATIVGGEARLLRTGDRASPGP